MKTTNIGFVGAGRMGANIPITWDFSHFGVVKHLAPEDFSRRLLISPELVQRACQFHFRPFNGHHCQVPVSAPDGSLSHELKEWLPFARAVMRVWLGGNRGTRRQIFVVPEMGPLSSGYNLTHWPNSWQEAIRLRSILEELWRGFGEEDLKL